MAVVVVAVDPLSVALAAVVHNIVYIALDMLLVAFVHVVDDENAIGVAFVDHVLLVVPLEGNENVWPAHWPHSSPVLMAVFVVAVVDLYY